MSGDDGHFWEWESSKKVRGASFCSNEGQKVERLGFSSCTTTLWCVVRESNTAMNNYNLTSLDGGGNGMFTPMIKIFTFPHFWSQSGLTVTLSACRMNQQGRRLQGFQGLCQLISVVCYFGFVWEADRTVKRYQLTSKNSPPSHSAFNVWQISRDAHLMNLCVWNFVHHQGPPRWHYAAFLLIYLRL